MNLPHQKYLDEVKTTLVNLFSDKADFVYLFGSILTPFFNDESDIDFAVYLKDDFDRGSFKLYSTVSEAFEPRKADLIILNTVDPIIIRQILDSGAVVFCNDDGKRLQFIAQKISQYIDLKMTRKIVEENLMRGKIYG